MTDDQFQRLMEMLNYQTSLLERIAIALETNQAAPNYQADLKDFHTFDWHSIGVEVERSDAQGAAIVPWRGLRFVRRSASNKFQPAIWFSRAVGKDELGNNRYERLITFKYKNNRRTSF
jgi:DdrB-like protein